MSGFRARLPVSLLLLFFAVGCGDAVTSPDGPTASGAPGDVSAVLGDRSPLDRYIVGTVPGAGQVARNAATEVYQDYDFGTIGQAVSGWFPEAALEGLRRNPNVRYVEAEGVMTVIDHAEDEGDPTEEQVLPWGIGRVGADLVHHQGNTGGGASIAIIDTGIDPNHETLLAVVAGGKAFVDCAGDCHEEWDDDHGHGTHVAGTAGAADNEIGVVGVSTDADLYAVKVLDGGGGGSFSDVAAGIKWTADEGIHVANLSLGGSHSEVVRDAVEYAYGKGVLLVAAAGNSGPRPRSVAYPAAYPEVIAVSAIDRSDGIARFSSRGEEVELAAPGVSVLSSVPGDEYESWNGTSMAAPHVAGAGAQLMAAGYDHTDARSRLNETAEDLGLDGTRQGSGLVDLAAALGIEDEPKEDDDEENGENGNGDEENGEEDQEITAEPEIDTFQVSTRTTGPWYRVDVGWVVSHDDGALERVTSELLDDDGKVLAERSSSVSGSEASGEHELRTRDGGASAVRLTVTDSAGNSTSETKDIDF